MTGSRAERDTQTWGNKNDRGTSIIMMGIISPTDEILSKQTVGTQKAVETVLAVLEEEARQECAGGVR